MGAEHEIIMLYNFLIKYVPNIVQVLIFRPYNTHEVSGIVKIRNKVTQSGRDRIQTQEFDSRALDFMLYCLLCPQVISL